MTLRIGWFSTGAGPGSQRQKLLTAAVEEMRSGDIDGEIAFVFCNRERGEYPGTDSYLDLVESLGLPPVTLSSRRFRRERGGDLSQQGQPLPLWRTEYDREVARLVQSHQFDVGVLAGYMLVFTGEMCNRYPLLNLHPALPGGPVGTWQDVVWQLFDARAERSGVMIHLATEELDRGPPVTCCSFELNGAGFAPGWEAVGSRSAADVRAAEGEENELFVAIRRQGAQREQPLVLETLRALADGRVRVEQGRVLDASGVELDGGLDLTVETDRALAGR